ncbi:Threonine efflux protein [Roseovarius sp. THAF9]|uniref:LysE family translocator n=1 Tax=Roseovarius sp. THAF9 TaxID=2587847 RepID=UPI0012AA1157|nr:LysE family transporter [Roseovarius sp. THAF9]QFT94486.1 Threonine efflux protein [Roseovarius sp. THAF9]
MSASELAMLTSVASFAFAAGSPGPATLAVAGTAMARGRSAGVAMALGLSLGLAVWGVLAGLGLGLLIAHFAPALLALKLVGAAYLIFLAFVSARSALRTDAAPDLESQGLAQGNADMFRRGLLLNVLNPKAVLAWVVALALGAGDALTIALCAGVGLGLYLFYATVFSLMPVRAGYARARRGIEAAFALFFGLAGVRLLFWRAEP